MIQTLTFQFQLVALHLRDVVAVADTTGVVARNVVCNVLDDQGAVAVDLEPTVRGQVVPVSGTEKRNKQILASLSLTVYVHVCMCICQPVFVCPAHSLSLSVYINTWEKCA